MKKITLTILSFLTISFSFAQIKGIKCGKQSEIACIAGGKAFVIAPNSKSSDSNYLGHNADETWDIELTCANDERFFPFEIILLNNFDGSQSSIKNHVALSIPDVSEDYLFYQQEFETASNYPGGACSSGAKKLRGNFEYTGAIVYDTPIIGTMTVNDLTAGTTEVIDISITYTEPLSNEKLEAFGFTFSPNPATSQLNLKANAMISNIELFNTLGQKAISKNINTLNTNLDLSNLKKGIYIMKATIGDKTGSYRIIKD